MFFCPKCNFTLNIHKNVNIDKINIVDIQELIDLVLSGNLNFSSNITKENIINSSIYKKLSKEEKVKINTFIDSSNNKVNIAHFVCNHCGYSFKLDDGTIIFKTSNVKHQKDDESIHNFRVNDCTLPRTKDFICPNSNCKPKNKEAIFYRPYTNSYTLNYICCECNAVWKSSIVE